MVQLKNYNKSKHEQHPFQKVNTSIWYIINNFFIVTASLVCSYFYWNFLDIIFWNKFWIFYLIATLVCYKYSLKEKQVVFGIFCYLGIKISAIFGVTAKILIWLILAKDFFLVFDFLDFWFFKLLTFQTFSILWVFIMFSVVLVRFKFTMKSGIFLLVIHSLLFVKIFFERAIWEQQLVKQLALWLELVPNMSYTAFSFVLNG